MSKYAMLAHMFGNPHMALRVVTRYDSFIVRYIMHSSTLKSKYLEYRVDANVRTHPGQIPEKLGLFWHTRFA